VSVYSKEVGIQYTVHLAWKRGGEVREKVEGQQYTSIVPSSMGATVHKLGRKYQQSVTVSPVFKSVKQNAAKSVNRSILKKSRHIGFCIFKVPSSSDSAVYLHIIIIIIIFIFLQQQKHVYDD
jgi:hypothetical protein